MKLYNHIISNSVTVTKNLIVSNFNKLKNTGIIGEIIFNSNTNTFYGWTGSKWIEIGGDSDTGTTIEKVILPNNTTINPNILKSIVQGPGSSDDSYIQWGAKIGGAKADPYIGTITTNKLVALNNIDTILVGVNYLSDPLNVYNFQNELAFTLPNNSGANMFINSAFISYNNIGQPTLVGRAGGISTSNSNSAVCTAVNINDLNEYIVTGYYGSTIQIYDNNDQFIATLTNYAPNGSSTDVFIIKYGNNNWVAKITGNSSQRGTNCSINDTISIVSGSFSNSTITVYNSDLLTFTLMYAGSVNNNSFIVKYNQLGTVDWTSKIVGGRNGYSDITNNSNILLGTNSTTDIYAYNSNGTIASTLTVNGPNNLLCVFNYLLNGSLKWSAAIRTVSFSSITKIFSVKIDSNNECIVAGIFDKIINVYDYDGTLAFSLTPITLGINGDAFIVKYDSSGKAKWGAKIAGLQTENNISVSSNDFGDIIVSGDTTSSLLYIFNGDGSLASTLATFNYDNIFIVNYSASGQYIWSSKIIPFVYTSSIDYNNLGNIVINGIYINTINAYNSNNNIGLTLTSISPDLEDAFLIKWNSATNLTLGSPANDGASKIILSSNPTIIINTDATISKNFNQIKLTKDQSVELLWDSIQDNWFLLNTTGSLN